MVEETNPEYSDEEALKQIEAIYGSASADQKKTLHDFLWKIVETPDVTRVGNLTQEEIGVGTITARALLDIISWCEATDQPEIADFKKKQLQNLIAPSLSKEGFLDRLSVITRKELSDVSPLREQKRRGWFGSRRKNQNLEPQLQ